MTPALTRLVWLSGRSDPTSVALSPPQRGLLEHCRRVSPALDIVTSNFPYCGERHWKPVPLPLAAWRNGAQFLSARWPKNAAHARTAWRAVCAGASRVLVITGSCGAELLRTVEPATPAGVTVLSLGLGPVAWSAPRSLALAIVGSRDRIAKPFVAAWRSPRPIFVQGIGHMDYLESADVHHCVGQWIVDAGERS